MINPNVVIGHKECGGNYSSPSGEITSPSYPNSYPDNSDCLHVISLARGIYVNFTVTHMDTDCDAYESGADYIEMIDGISEDSPLMGRFCGDGNNIPTYMQTTQNYLRIR